MSMRCVLVKNKYSVYDIELCDILYAVNEECPNYVALITDIIKNENDEINHSIITKGMKKENVS